MTSPTTTEASHPPCPEHPRFYQHTDGSWNFEWKNNIFHRITTKAAGNFRDDCANAAIVAWEDEYEAHQSFSVGCACPRCQEADGNAAAWRDWKKGDDR